MNSHILATLTVTVPIILLIILGQITRVTRVISDGGLQDIKKLIVNVALPAVFFQTFLTIEVDPRYLVLNVAVLAILTVLLLAGYLIARLPLWGGSPATVPFLMTGFEFGMLGISLFGTVWGMDRIGAISVLGLPHELFIWFLYVTLLKRRFGGETSPGATLRSFVSSPIIIAIFAGVILNVTGIGAALSPSLPGQALLRTTDLVGSIIGPLILLVIGHGMRIRWSAVVAAAPLVLIRGAVVVAMGLFMVPWLIALLGLPPIYQHALFTLLILLRPFIIPLYLPAERKDDLAYANTVLSTYTLFSIVVFILYVTMMQG